MFDSRIVNSDPFLDLPAGSQALYFHLGIHADDDGFVYPKKVMRMMGSSDDEMKLLLHKKFLIPFESGVVVVKHWRVNNYIRPDRYHPTSHRRELAQLSLDKGLVYHLSTNCPTEVSKEVSKKVIGSNDHELENAGTRELTAEERDEFFRRSRPQLAAKRRITNK